MTREDRCGYKVEARAKEHAAATNLSASHVSRAQRGRLES
jgi:hypothetical protein